MRVESIDKKIAYWIDKNRDRIIDNIGKPYFYSDADVRDFVSMFPFDYDMDMVAQRLYVGLCSISFTTIIDKKLSKAILDNEIKKSALFSTLDGYAKQTFVEDLIRSFPFEECEKALRG